MKTFISLLLLLGLIAFMVHLASDAANEQPAQPARPVEHKTVNAELHAGVTTLRITNRDATNWPPLNVFINGDPLFTFGCGIPSLDPGSSITLPLVEFTKDKTGERFSPLAYKVTKVWIGGNGFDYEAYGF